MMIGPDFGIKMISDESNKIDLSFYQDIMQDINWKTIIKYYRHLIKFIFLIFLFNFRLHWV